MEEQQTKSNADLALHALDYVRVFRNRWKEILLTGILVFITSVVVTFLSPQQFRTSVQFKINMPRGIINVTQDNTDIAREATAGASYIPTQYAIITTQECLKFVVRKLDLTKEWSTSEAAAASMLQGMITVNPVINTDLVDVVVTASDPNLAKNIAEAIPDAYRDRRTQEEKSYVELAIKKLHETLSEQQAIVADKLSSLRIRFTGDGAQFRSPDSTQTFAMEEEQLSSETSLLRQQETEINLYQVHAKAFKSLTPNELTDYVITSPLMTVENIESGNLRSIHKQFSDKALEEESLIALGIGPNHPRMKAYKSEYQRLKEKLDASVQNLVRSLSSNIDIKRQTIDATKKRVAEKELLLRKKLKAEQEFIEARNEYKKANEQLDRLQTQYFSELTKLRVPRIPITVYRQPVYPSAPFSPKVTLNLSIGAVAGLALGFLVAFLLEFFDTSVKTMEEVERALKVPVVGIIPQNVALLHASSRASADAEAYRILRTNIEFNKRGLEEVTLTFVSGSAGEGKTTTLCNLAYVCAQAGYSTLMLDGDLRRSKLNKYFELDNSIGLTNYLLDDAPLEECIMQTSTENLFIMPSGPSPRDPSGVLNSRRMHDLMIEVKQRFDIILVDSPPILGVSDASVISSEVDLTLMVVQPRKLPLKALMRQKQIIDSVGGHLAGVVLNNVDISSDHQYQYYTTYYSYYSQNEDVSPVDDNLASPKRKRSGGSNTAANTQAPESDLY